MKNRDFCPLAVLFGYIAGTNKLIFIGREGEKIIDGYSSEIISILKYCNGLNTISTIKRKLPQIGKKVFYALLDLLLEQSIVCDSRSIYEIFHKDSNNPPEFSYKWNPEEVAVIEKTPKRETKLEVKKVISLGNSDSGILKLIHGRHTTRHFKNVSITKKNLIGLLESVYRTNGYRSIPSAGGLYPLEIYIVIIKKIGNIKRGWYQYSSSNQTLSLLNIPSGVEKVCPILDSAGSIKNASFIIFFGADFSRTATKYANRGYRFVLMEIGHAAQNANLYCVENGLGALEWGGFSDGQLAKTLKLDYPKQGIALAMIIGVPDNNKKNQIKEPYFDECRLLKAELVGKNKPIEFIRIGEVGCGDYVMPRFVASAKYNCLNNDFKQDNNFAFGSGRTTNEASVKVIAEAFERYAAGFIKIDKISAAESLDRPFVDPRLINPSDIKQHKLFNFEIFDFQKKWQWILGERYNSKEETYVAIDNVFYPIYPKVIGRKLCCNTNSSGVAAHFKKEIATEKALLELIERDAIMSIWYSKKEITALPHNLTSVSTRDRINFWKSQKRQVKFLNFTLDSVPVVVCFIISENDEYPCLVSGASADFSFRLAMEKAFNEAEYMLLSWWKVDSKRIIDVKDVVKIADHGRLYFWPEHQHHLLWLINAEEKKIIKTDKRKDIFSQFNPVIINITPNKENSLFVIRVVSEKLMPINFGYSSEYYGHDRLKMLGLKWNCEYPSQPHFFA